MSFKLDTLQYSLQGASYIALSYCWGDPNPKKEILINNTIVEVYINLYRALEHLMPNVNLPIWIDAICINQNDPVEKELQISQMRDIYRNAKRTVIWLGEGDASTDRVMKQLDRIGKDAFEAGVLDLDINDMKVWPNLESNKANIKTRLDRLMPRMVKGYEDKVPFPILDLIDLSYRPWFRRVWVVQELSVASNYAFICGNEWVPGDHFIAGFLFSVIWIANELKPLKQGGALFWLPFKLLRIWWRNGWPLLRTFFERIQKAKPLVPSPRAATTLGTRKKFQTGSGLSLKLQLARAFTLASDGSLDATNPKDRIYALLGIANDAEELDIKPDCRRETGYQEVYMAVAKLLIQHGHVDILSLCRPCYCNDNEKLNVPHRDPDLPSWTTDWTHPLLSPWGHYIEDKLFRASGNTKVPAQIKNLYQPDDPKMLYLDAVFVGILSELGSAWKPRFENDFDYSGANTLFTEVERFLNKSETRYTDDERQEAVWRVPIGDKEMNELGQTRRATDASYNEYLIVKANVSNDPNLLNRTRMVCSLSYMSAMKDMQDARPFISDGGYVGLCPDGSEPGDEIYIPLGSHVPFVFRKVDRCVHILVGEAYVHGIMDGKIFKTDPPSQILRLL